MTDSSDPYDAMPYESSAYPQSHPDHLAVIATLFGMAPRSLEHARVLEIGCAGGGNLLPLAACYPGSYFVGVDPSGRQIAEANAGVAALGLGNAVFHAMGLEAMDPEFGSFDYIIAHGVYSWVGEPVREALMALCSRLLAPEGVAYVSFNTKPGSVTRGTVRDMVRYRTRDVADPSERVRQARGFLTFLEESLGGREDPYARSLTEELSQIAQAGDFYLTHEHLEENNEPCYFHEFMSHARRHGLQFLGESEIRSLSGAGLPASVRNGLRGLAAGMEDAEQYADFVRNRAFRQTLLCRAGVELKRSVSPEVVRQFRIASCLDPVQEAGGAVTWFRDADGVELQVRDALTVAALQELRAVWPASLTFLEVLAKAAARAEHPTGPREAALLGNGLLACYSTARGLEFQRLPRPFRTSVAEFPRASPLSRWQVTRGLRVTNQRHENVLLRPEEGAVLRQLDGRHGLADLRREFPDAGPLLEYFARTALLVD